MTELELWLRERLFARRDEAYRTFHSGLMPTIDPDTVIGVRMPVLRKLAGEFIKQPGSEAFLEMLPHKYYEENNLHGILIGRIAEYNRCVQELERFLPYVDNWATCDLISPVCVREHPAEFLTPIHSWLLSDHTYTIRFGLGMLLKFYLDERFQPEYPALAASVRSDEYYVRMMQAWYFATALAKQWETALPYLAEKRLDTWVHNKTIRKAIESRRIPAAQKAYLRTLKR